MAEEMLQARRALIRQHEADMQCYLDAGQEKKRVFKLPGICIHTELGPLRLDGVKCTIEVKGGVMTSLINSAHTLPCGSAPTSSTAAWA